MPLLVLVTVNESFTTHAVFTLLENSPLGYICSLRHHKVRDNLPRYCYNSII